jgi:hypothetical protein
MSGGEERVPIDWSDPDVQAYVRACRAGRPREQKPVAQPVGTEGMSEAQKRHEYYRRWYARHRDEQVVRKRRKRNGGDK